MAETLGSKAAKGAIWATIDRFGYLGLQFFVNLILARLLMPDDFGAVGMLLIFIAVSNVLVDSGFGSALVQKKTPTQTDYSTVLYWNISFSVLLYAVLFVLSPLIADFFKYPILRPVLQVYGIVLITNGVSSILLARLRKQLAFKQIAISDLSAYMIASCMGTYLAYHGYGVWSLVGLQIAYGVILIGMLWSVSRWRPSLEFSKESLRQLFGFGGYIMAASILQEACKNLQGIIIGKKFSATQMGYYSQAAKLEQVSSTSLPQVIVQVMYPVYSAIQDDAERLVSVLRMNIRVISFVAFPIVSILIIAANPIIIGLYGEKWLPSVPYFQVLCVGGFFTCLQNINFYAVAAVGKSRALFRWSFYKWGFLLVALLVGAIFGMYGILWGMVLSNINIYLVNAYLTAKYVELTFAQQILTLLPVAGVCGSAVMISLLITAVGFHFTVAVATFMIVYFGLSILLRLRALRDAIALCRRLMNRR